MSLAIELPDKYAEDIKSGKKTYTFQLQDKIRVGDIINIHAGPVAKKVKIVRKVWVPETQMDDHVRSELMDKVSAAEGYSGAYQLTLEYTDDGEVPREKFGKEADQVADLMDFS